MNAPFIVAIDETVITCFWFALIAVINGIVVSPLLWGLSQEVKNVAVIPSRRKLLMKGINLVSTLTLILNMLILFKLVDLINFQGWSL